MMSLIILLIRYGARKFEFKWVSYAYQYRMLMNIIHKTPKWGFVIKSIQISHYYQCDQLQAKAVFTHRKSYHTYHTACKFLSTSASNDKEL